MLSPGEGKIKCETTDEQTDGDPNPMTLERALSLSKPAESTKLGWVEALLLVHRMELDVLRVFQRGINSSN